MNDEKSCYVCVYVVLHFDKKIAKAAWLDYKSHMCERFFYRCFYLTQNNAELIVQAVIFHISLYLHIQQILLDID